MEIISESRLFQKYKPNYLSAVVDFFVHSVHFVAAVYAVWLLKNSWLSTVSVPFLGLMLHRTYVVFHDCGHNSYSPSKPANFAVGTICGIATFTSTNWMLDHGVHHLTNGNANNKYGFKFNELLYYTANQYKKFNWGQKCAFAFFHTPPVFFTVFPLLYFGGIQRFIYLLKKLKYGDKIGGSTLTIAANHAINNLGIIGLLYAMREFGILPHYLVAAYIGAIIDFLLFFNQHTYNPCYVVRDDKWTQRDSGLRGSSFIQIPERLKYFTMGIEYHHIHHMNSRIPGYNLRGFHEEVEKSGDNKLFAAVVKLDMSDCFHNLWLSMYDEDKGRYVTRQEVDEEIISGKKRE